MAEAPSFRRVSARLLVIAVVSLVISATDVIQTLDRNLYDLPQRQGLPATSLDDIVIVGIDDISLDIMSENLDGLVWPFPRAVHAQIIRNLMNAGAKVVFFDVLFDLPSGHGSNDDDLLAEAIRLGSVFLAVEDSPNAMTPMLPKFAQAGAMPANIYLPMDSDGVIRAVSHDTIHPFGFLKTLIYLFGLERLIIGEDAYTSDFLSPAEIISQTEFPDSSFADPGLISFFGPPGSFPYFSFFEVYDPVLFGSLATEFKNKFVLVGASSSASITPTAAADMFLTPHKPNWMPGVEIHANALASLLKSEFRYLVPSLSFVLVFFLFSLLFGFLLNRLSGPWTAMALSVVGIAGVEIVSLGLFQFKYVLPVIPLALVVILLWAEITARRYLKERDEKLLVKGQLFQYLPAKVARHVLAQPQRLAMSGDRSRLTILFADLAGFTSLSESLGAGEIVPILQEHLGGMTEIIFEHEGTLDKYLGDGIMAFWGAPEQQDDQANLALSAGKEMLKQLELHNRVRRSVGKPALKMRVGIHTGDAVVGNIGSRLFIDYTAIGDSVNTASRIEGVNNFFGTTLLVSESTRAALSQPQAAELRCVARVTVKNRKSPLSVFTLPGDDRDSYDALENYLAALDRKDIGSAQRTLDGLSGSSAEFPPLVFYLERKQAGEFPEYDKDGLAYFKLESK